MTDTAESPEPQARRSPEGIGGWLIIPIVGLFITPLRALWMLVSTYGEAIENLHLLTPPQGGLIIAEVVLNGIISIVLPAVLLVLLFRKSMHFPPAYIGWALAGLTFILLDTVAAYYAFREYFDAGDAALFDEATLRELARNVVLAVVWVPYMLLSKRVRNTFGWPSPAAKVTGS